MTKFAAINHMPFSPNLGLRHLQLGINAKLCGQLSGPAGETINPPFFLTSFYAASNPTLIFQSRPSSETAGNGAEVNPVLSVAKEVRYRMQGLEIAIDLQRSSRPIFRNKHMGPVDQNVQMVPLYYK